MKLKLIALFCIFLIISSSLGISVDSQTERTPLSDLFSSEEETGESIIINVDGIEPITLTTDVIENQNAPVYVYLKGTTLGGLAFGAESPKSTPFYGLPKIRSVNIVPADAETRKYFSGYQYVRPLKGQYVSKDGLIDFGYLIVILKRIPKESDVPDQITLAFDADVRFDLESGFGNFGSEDLVLTEQANEQSWKQDLKQNKKSTFWGSTGLVRASRVDQNSVSLTIYNGLQQPISSLTLKEGETSSPITLRSNIFTVYDRFRVKLNSINIPTDKVLLSITKSGDSPQEKYLSVGQRLYTGSNWKIIEIKSDFQLLENGQAVVKDGKNVYVSQVVIRSDKGEVKALNLKNIGTRPTSIPTLKPEEYLTKLVGTSLSLSGLNDFLTKISSYNGDINTHSNAYGVDPDLVKVVIWKESSGNPNKGVSGGGIGLMGVTLSTARAVAKELGYKNPDQLTIEELKNPPINIQLGTKYLANRISRQGAIDLGVQSYNTGDGLLEGANNWNGLYSLLGRGKTWIEYNTFLQNDNSLKERARQNLGKTNDGKYIFDLMDFNYATNVMNVYNAILSSKNLQPVSATSTSQPSTIDCSSVEINDNIASEFGDYLNQDVLTLKKKTYCTAINELKKVIELNPESEEANEAYFYLGKSYEELNNYGEAKFAYSLIKRTSIYYDHAQLAIKQIGAVESSGKEVDRIYLEDEDAYIVLNEVSRLSEKDSPIAYISIGSSSALPYTKDKTLMEDKIDENKETFNWVVDEVNANNVIIKRFYYKRTTSNKYSDYTTLSINSVRNIVTDGKDKKTSIQVTKIDTKQEAYITILPGTGREVSRSSFNVHIPIDKRPFQFTPEQIDSQIAKTREIVEKLNSIINRLDNAIRVWTTLCFGVYGVLIVKNFFTSPIKVKAREQVMHGVDGKSGWSKFCTENSGYDKNTGAKKLYINYDECIFDNEEIISKQTEYAETYVEEKQDALKNKDLDKKSSIVDENYISGESLAEKEALDHYIANLKSSNINNNILNDEIKLLETSKENLDNEINYREDANKAAEEYVKSIKDYEKLEEKEQLKLYHSRFQQVLDSKKKNAITEPIADTIPFIGLKTENEKQIYYTYESTGLRNLTPAKKVEYLAYLKKLETETNSFTPVFPSQDPLDYDLDAKQLKLIKIKEQIKQVEGIDDNAPIISSSGKTVYKSSDEKFVIAYNEQYVNQEFKIRKDYAVQRIEYYEDGKPYCVPTGNGNYAKVLEYYANGQPKTIAEWNVGPNGIICDDDDIPITSEDVLKLPDRETQSNTLKRSINNAGFCKTGEKSLPGLSGKWFCSTARAQLEQQVTQLHCEDSMDILDCKILFNVCDPVMCPSSRFNLGGKWQLGRRSVAETGLIGSLVLGLPNFVGFGGSDIVPICLTGVSAGLKNWRSVFQGYEQCLQVSKTQDRSVGICNQVRSVFMCEILWKEGLAILDVNKGLLSLGVESIYNGLEGNGGGEYISLKDNFDNSANSFKFFSQEYARSAFAAYEARSTDEIGTEICKAAIFSKSPGIGKFFEDLTSPESPPQFTAFFDSTIYSSQAGLTRENTNAGLLSSIQEQSKYNIYYHIYAGEDREVYYSVFLMDRFRSLRPLYVTLCDNPLAVRRLINRGDYVDNSCTKIAATGYDQVCVEINGRVECGFGKVTSSFGLDYIQDLVVEDEALNLNINSTEECRPNNPTFTSQYGLESGSGKQYGLLNTGIVRVCNPSDPGLGTNSDNWESVGVCTRDSQGNVLSKCWIDRKTIDINNIATNAEVLNTLKKQGLIDESKSDLITKEQADKNLEELNVLFNGLFYLQGSSVVVRNELSKSISDKDEKIRNNALLKIQNIIKYKEYSTGDLNYRYLVSVSPDLKVISEGRIKIAQAYYALGNLLVANKNALISSNVEKTNVDAKIQAGKGLLPLKINLVNKFDLGFLGSIDLVEKDFTYTWDGKKWQNGNDLTPTLSKSTNVNVFNEGLDFIIFKRILSNNEGSLGRLLTKVEVTCGGENNKLSIYRERFDYDSLKNNFNDFINKCNINQNFQIGLTQTSEQEQKKTLITEKKQGVAIEITKEEETGKKTPIKDAQVKAKTESKSLESENIKINLKPIKYEIAPLQIENLNYDLNTAPSLPLQQVKVIELEFNTPEMAFEFEKGVEISPIAQKQIPLISAEPIEGSTIQQEPEKDEARNKNLIYESEIKIDEEEVIIEIDKEDIKEKLLEQNLDEIIKDLDTYLISIEKTTATNEDGKVSINLNSGDSQIVISDEDEKELFRFPLSELNEEKELTCEQVNLDQKTKSRSEGAAFSCNPSSSCRTGDSFNKGQLNCGQGTSCCRTICGVAYPEYQCTDTTKFSCDSEIKKGYCPGTSDVICCKRGSAKLTTTDSTSGFTIYPDINQKILGIIQGNKEYAENLKICEGINCAGYTAVTSDYVFGAGRRFITGAFGNAWDLPASVEERNGEVTFYDWESGNYFTNYDSLNPGDVLGLHYTESHFKPNELYKDIGESEAKYGWQRGNTPEIDFTHAALYLGKYNGKNYITHFIHDEGSPKVETIENLLSNRYPGKMFTRAVMRMNQDNLYKPIPTYSTNNYVVKEGDSIRGIAYSLSNGLSTDENSWLIANYNNIYEPNYLEAEKTIKVPGNELISTKTVNVNDVSGNLAKKINNKYDKEDNDDFGLKWSRIIYTNAKYKTPEYLSLIASIIDTETGFNTQTSEKTQQILFNLAPNFLKDITFTNAGKDIGCMDIKLCKAINIEREIGNKNDPEEVVYDKITTDEGCVYYGEQYLRRISEPFLKDDSSLTNDKINYILSEYVAGEYSSRNSAFQKQVSELTGLQLDLDGDLLIYEDDCSTSDTVSNTERAIRLIISNNNFGITNSDLRKMLLKEKSKNFEDTDIYKKIKTLYKKELNKDPEYLILPNAARYSNLGTSKDKLSINFVEDVLPNYNHYCSDICALT